MRRDSIDKVLTRDPITAHTGQPLSDIRKVFAKEGFHHMPVVSGKQLIGMISASDILGISVEGIPTDERSGYSRQVVWYDQAEYRMQKVDFYDRKNELLKTLTYHDYQQYAGRFWRADPMEMVNHQTGKSTTLTWSDYAFGTGLSDRDFDQSALQRAR